jgi:hypothetical protein
MTTIVINSEEYSITLTPCVEAVTRDANGGVISRRVVQQATIDTLGEQNFYQGEVQDAYNIVHPPPAEDPQPE